MHPILVTPEDHREVPWRNGRGTSFQVWPRGSAAGRAGFQFNLTPIIAGGPFSHYPGIDRVLAVVTGSGLSFDGRDGAVATGDIVAFAGEAAMVAHLARGSVAVFNLLMKRVEWTAAAHTIRGGAFELAPLAGELGVVHAAAGRWRCAALAGAAPGAGPTALGEASTLIARPGERLAFEPAVDGAMALAFTLRRRS